MISADLANVAGDEAGVGTMALPPTALSLNDASAIATRAMKVGELSKVDGRLAALYYASGSQAVQMAAFIDANPALPHALAENGVVVDVSVAAGATGAQLLAQLQGLGLTHGSTYAGVVSGVLPISSIAALSGLASVATASESGFYTNTGSVTTQADQAQKADVARSATGLTGAGVRVGVISDSFDTATSASDHAAQNVASDDLPTGIRVLQDYRGGTDEGRAMAQLIHDLAPGAGIDFASADYGQAGFANNIIRLAQAGDKVIVDDVGYFGELAFQNGPIGQAVNYVAATYGVTYLSSSGNNGVAAWTGNWRSGGTFTVNNVNYTSMSFDGNDYLTYTGSNAAPLVLYWDSPSAIAGGTGSPNDLDIFIYSDAALTTITGRATAQNVGGDAYELLYPGISGATTTTARYIRIGWNTSASSVAPGAIKLEVEGNGRTVNLQNTPSNQSTGTLVGHAAAENGIAVGASPYYANPVFNSTTYPKPLLESYSSGGPQTFLFTDYGTRYATPHVTSVGIVGTDGGNTTFFSGDDSRDADTFPNFYGTSAAAPDVAAVVALVLQANPALSRTDVLAILQATAIDMDDPATPSFDTGFDARTGPGFVQADAAVKMALATINGTANADTINGDGSDNIIHGNGGADVIHGGGGNDLIYGDDGADTLFGDDGNDTLVGGDGDDVLDGGLGADTLSGGAGFNTASYASAPGAVIVNLAAHTSSGAAGVDTLQSIQAVVGSNFNDIILGTTFGDVIDGGMGDDLLVGGGGVDTVSYASATSGVTVSLQTTSQQNTIGAGRDSLSGFTILQGSNYGDTLTAADAAIVHGGAGDDFIYGPRPVPTTTDRPDIIKAASTTNNSIANAVNLTGAFDLVSNVNITDSITLPHATIQATVGSTAEFEYYAVNMTAPGRIVADIDSYPTAVTDAFLLLQDANGNIIAFNDDGDGDPGDTTTNNSFIDTVVTTPGTYYVVVAGYTPSGSGYTVNPANQTYTLHVSAQNAAVTYDGGARPGGSGAIYGDAGNDTLLDSGSSASQMYGGTGNDTYEVRSAGTLVVENPGEGIDTVYSYLNDYTLTTNVEKLFLAGSAVYGRGNDLDNTIVGNAGDNVLIGGAGGDYMYGGAGNDTYDVRDAGDMVIENANEGIDVVYSYLNDYTLPANVEKLFMVGSAVYGRGNDLDNTIVGTAGDNVLIGGAGNDYMYGGAGADTYEVREAGDMVIENANEGTDVVYSYLQQYALTNNVENLVLVGSAQVGVGNGLANTIVGNAQANFLNGGAGNDTLTGGAGVDTFYWLGAQAGRDVVTDFNAASGEQIVVAANVFANYAAVQAAETQVGNNVVITLDANTTLTLVGVTTAQLTPGNFQFYNGPY